MELKLCLVEFMKNGLQGSNRTFMELKHAKFVVTVAG